MFRGEAEGGMRADGEAWEPELGFGNLVAEDPYFEIIDPDHRPGDLGVEAVDFVDFPAFGPVVVFVLYGHPQAGATSKAADGVEEALEGVSRSQPRGQVKEGQIVFAAERIQFPDQGWAPPNEITGIRVPSIIDE
jgi:hypothetical protein